MDRWYNLDLVLRYRGANSVKRWFDLSKCLLRNVIILSFERDIILFKPIFD
jgi:hypothetical protein